MSSYCTRDQRAYCIRSTTWHQTVNLVSSLNSNPNLSVWQMVCLVDPIIIAGSSAVCNLLHLLSSCSKEWLAERHLRGRERETERDHRRAGIDRCRGRKRDREHLSTLLPAEECLSPQAAEYETRSQLQLMAKWSICLDYIAVRFLPQRQGQKQGRKGINLRSAWPIQTLLWKFTCTARVTWYTLEKVPNILSHEASWWRLQQPTGWSTLTECIIWSLRKSFCFIETHLSDWSKSGAQCSFTVYCMSTARFEYETISLINRLLDCI